MGAGRPGHDSVGLSLSLWVSTSLTITDRPCVCGRLCMSACTCLGGVECPCTSPVSSSRLRSPSPPLVLSSFPPPSLPIHRSIPGPHSPLRDLSSGHPTSGPSLGLSVRHPRPGPRAAPSSRRGNVLGWVRRRHLPRPPLSNPVLRRCNRVRRVSDVSRREDWVGGGRGFPILFHSPPTSVPPQRPGERRSSWGLGPPLSSGPTDYGGSDSPEETGS